MTTDPIDALREPTGPRWLIAHPDGRVEVEGPIEPETPLLPGSFNPLHHGHEQLARVAAELLGRTVNYELAVVNVDKPPLSPDEVRHRLTQFEEHSTVVLTRAPRFLEKARLFHRTKFVIGWDTAVRLVDQRYYDDSHDRMTTALEEMRAAAVHFVVGGRTHEGEFRTLQAAHLPAGFASMFESIPEELFRADVSSTELRSD